MPYRNPASRAVTPQGRGRFPGYDVLDEVHRWDDHTAGVVLERLGPTSDLSFFDLAETAAATALCDRLLAQDEEPKVPVVAMLDARLAAGETDGWHYDDMPSDEDAWRRTLAALDEEAKVLGGVVFAGLPVPDQVRLIEEVQDSSTAGEKWHGLPAAHVWSLWTRYACTAFYSHPWAWNEIGFGGPAYPRGYKHRAVDGLEPWEVRDAVGTDPRTVTSPRPVSSGGSASTTSSERAEQP
jgi:hypothetical protein